MSRPTTKQDLILAGNEQFKKMWEIINSINEDEQKDPFNFNSELLGKEAHWQRDKNIRDILIHLYEWHELLLKWVKSNQSKEPNPFLPEPYNWKTYGKMNIEFWKKHQMTPYEQAKNLLKESHNKVIELIGSFSNEELFSKGRFVWTGGSTLGQYCISVTSSHYDWAMKKIKLYIKGLKK